MTGRYDLVNYAESGIAFTVICKAELEGMIRRLLDDESTLYDYPEKIRNYLNENLSYMGNSAERCQDLILSLYNKYSGDKNHAI